MLSADCFFTPSTSHVYIRAHDEWEHLLQPLWIAEFRAGEVLRQLRNAIYRRRTRCAARFWRAGAAAARTGSSGVFSAAGRRTRDCDTIRRILDPVCRIRD